MILGRPAREKSIDARNCSTELPFGKRTPSPLACARSPVREKLTRSVVVRPTRTRRASITVRPSTNRRSRASIATGRPVAAVARYSAAERRSPGSRESQTTAEQSATRHPPMASSRLRRQPRRQEEAAVGEAGVVTSPVPSGPCSASPGASGCPLPLTSDLPRVGFRDRDLERPGPMADGRGCRGRAAGAGVEEHLPFSLPGLAARGSRVTARAGAACKGAVAGHGDLLGRAPAAGPAGRLPRRRRVSFGTLAGVGPVQRIIPFAGPGFPGAIPAGSFPETAQIARATTRRKRSARRATAKTQPMPTEATRPGRRAPGARPATTRTEHRSPEGGHQEAGGRPDVGSPRRHPTSTTWSASGRSASPATRTAGIAIASTAASPV